MNGSLVSLFTGPLAVEDSRLRGWMMLALVALVCAVALVVVLLMFMAWRRDLKRQQKTPEASDSQADPWVEAGKRVRMDSDSTES